MTIETDPPAPSVQGRQILAVIAVSGYEHWTPLAGPVRDAREIRDILVERYRIDRLFELYDEQATKANIIRLLSQLQEEVEPDDSLLILYCGHGHLDRRSDTGFWIPVNAGTDTYEQLNWLPHAQLKGLLSNVPARHILVISDSCFAGDLLYATRSFSPVDAAYLQSAYARVSRLVLTSGAAEEVPDVSEFARELKTALRRNTSSCLDASMLYSEVRLGVSSVVPQLGILAGTGHQEGGSFLLFLREELVGARTRTGRLTVASDRPGELSVDGIRWGDLDEGARELEGIGLGEHRISLAFDDGTFDEKRVVVGELPAETIFFDGRPPPADVVGVPSSPGHLSAGGRFLGLFPVAAAANVLGAGPGFVSGARYDFRVPWGSFGLGVMAGLIALWTREDAAYGYEMLSIPLALEAGVRTASSPWSWTFDLRGGVMVNRVTLHVAEPTEFTTVAAFLAPSLGAGIRVSDRLRILADVGFLAVFFPSNPVTGVSLGLGVEHAFGRR